MAAPIEMPIQCPNCADPKSDMTAGYTGPPVRIAPLFPRPRPGLGSSGSCRSLAVFYINCAKLSPRGRQEKQTGPYRFGYVAPIIPDIGSSSSC